MCKIKKTVILSFSEESHTSKTNVSVRTVRSFGRASG